MQAHSDRAALHAACSVNALAGLEDWGTISAAAGSIQQLRYSDGLSR
jgi:hypothetical protein